LVQQLFKDFEKLHKKEGMEDQKQEIVSQLCTELSIHAQVEEEIFYPAVRQAIKDDDLMDEAVVEHAGVKDLVSQLQSMQPGDQYYDAKVTVLAEEVTHHVQEEQEKMFVKAKRAKLDLQDLAVKIQQRKEELQAEMSATVVG